ncbi:MAG: rhodanese-like domain-containing protein [bacterium]
MSASTTARTITAEELSNLIKSGTKMDLIDVRTPAEFREIHAEPAKSLPLDKLSAEAVRSLRTTAADQPLYVICKSGNRGRQACEKLSAAGLNVVNVEGGTTAWAAAGLPVVRGKKMMSLERQVRIVAGSLVFAGTLAGAFANPLFLVIPGFVGAGLVFAGVTDTCGMAMMLARMPWNQVKAGASCSVK